MADTTSDTIVDGFTQDLHLGSSGAIRAEARRMADGDTDWRLAMFHAETPADVHADHWEKHPQADELVGCVRGAIRLCLRAIRPDTPDDVIRLLAGQVTIVPRDRWHRFEFEEPTDILAVTLRQGTELERRTV